MVAWGYEFKRIRSRQKMNSDERDFMENIKRLSTVLQRVGRRNLHGEVSYCICFANREN